MVQAQKMAAIGQLAGGVAHDFNNIITVIKSFGSFVVDALPPSGPAREDMREVLAAAERAEHLTRQLLAFSRRQAVEPRVMNINGLVTRTEKMLRRLVGEDIDLVSISAEELRNVRVDPGAFEQVLVNLAVNARDAMPLGGRLTIETANVALGEEEAARRGGGMTGGDYVWMAVRDTGVGIPEGIQERVFEPFFTTKGKGRGTGLGLSTCYGIVKQAGGWIWIQSEPDQGTTFEVFLPAVADAADELEEIGLSSDLRGTETVLVVEDADQVRALAVRSLAKHGYAVLDARDGGEALRLCGQHGGAIDLLLTDVVMPTMGGRELADRIASLLPETKVLFMSGYTDDAIAHHGVLEPGTALLQKPFTPEALCRRVRDVLDHERADPLGSDGNRRGGVSARQESEGRRSLSSVLLQLPGR
jgi:CheY-like chemotaxis protein